MRAGTAWKHKRSCERYLSTNKMHSFFRDCTCLGSFLRIRGGALSAGCEEKNAGKSEERTPSTVVTRGRESWMFSTVRHLFENKRRHIQLDSRQRNSLFVSRQVRQHRAPNVSFEKFVIRSARRSLDRHARRGAPECSRLRAPQERESLRPGQASSDRSDSRQRASWPSSE